jgi:hypothetical protein
MVAFDGAREELVHLIVSLPARTRAAPFSPRTCPTCGKHDPSARIGPPCPGCQQPTQDNGGGYLWCVTCRVGYKRARAAATPSAGA